HRTVELALTHDSVLEVDGDLHQLLSPSIGPIVHLHLKGVPGAFDTGQIQHVQCRGPPDLEARGHITYGHGQHGLDIGVGPAAEKPSAQPPLLGEATAGNVTTTDDHTGIGGVQSAQQLGNITHGVAEIGVHLHDVVGPVLQGPGHTLDVGTAQPVLVCAVHDRQSSAGTPHVHGEFVGDLTGTVRGVVVDHHDP